MMNQELFGITPPKKLFVKLAIPSLVSMLFSSIYMMADGMFVGKVIGSKALAAINLVFPIIMIVFAVSDMIAAGASVKIGIKLGEKKEEEASNIFSIALLLFSFWYGGINGLYPTPSNTSTSTVLVNISV